MNHSLQHDPDQHGSDPTPRDDSHTNTHTALVLGGGGSTGNAWLIGVIAGLFDNGLDVTQADLTVGTSAGATAAAQLAGATPAELFADILAPTTQPAPTASAFGPAPTRAVTNQLEKTNAIIAASKDAADRRRRMGAAALETTAALPESVQTQWRATVASRFASQLWPERRMLLTAVEAHIGEPVAFDRDSGVDLVDAVAASCSSRFAYRIGDHHYIDGGYRTNAENADLAAGYERVLVLSPFGGRSLTPIGWGMHLATQVDELRTGGSRVETIFPDSDSEHMFGSNAMDLSLRPPAAQVGYDQGKVLAGQLTEFWR